jgi:outer membrane protein TolC
LSLRRQFAPWWWRRGNAETLRDALVQTYNGNPTIAAQRAQVRTLDAGVAIARSQEGRNCRAPPASTRTF